MPNDKESKSDSRKKVDDKIDGAASNVLTKLGVPKTFADKAVKDNGGKFSPGNFGVNKLSKNFSRNKLADGLDKVNGNNSSNKSGIVSPNNNKVDNPENSDFKKNNNFKNNQKANSDNRNIKASEKNSNSKLDSMTSKGKNSLKNGFKNFFNREDSEANGDVNAEVDNGFEGSEVVSNSLKKIKDIVLLIFKLNPYLIFVPIVIIAFVFVSTIVSNIVQTFFETVKEEVVMYLDSYVNGVTAFADEISPSDSDVFKEDEAFINNVKKVKDDSYSSRKINVYLVFATFQSICDEDDSYDLNSFTTDQIKKVVDAMYENGSYNEEKFYEKIKDFLESDYFTDYDDSQIKEVVKNIKSTYNSFGYEFKDDSNSNDSSCTALGSCNYILNGTTNGSRVINNPINASNIKVRLMQAGNVSGHSCGGTYGVPIEGEELVDFEKYVMGVASGESGNNPDEAIKAQIIAARSFSLGRAMIGGNGRKIENENGNWILQITNCVSDQVYCDPDKGCSKNVPASNQWGYLYSGSNTAKYKYKDPLPANNRLRSIAPTVIGEVLVDSTDHVLQATYASKVQNKWAKLANSNYDYKQILASTYGGYNIKKMTCNTNGQSNCISNAGTGSQGDFSNWKQSKQSWSSIHLGGSSNTIASSGCLVTSISMLLARSGIQVNVDGELNPGTFVNKLNQIGGLDGGGNFLWGSVTKIAPNFVYGGKVNLSGMPQYEKLNILRQYSNQGYAIVVEVKGNTGQHWVALDKIDGDQVLMFDPASSAKVMWDQYPSNNTSKFAYYKVG